MTSLQKVDSLLVLANVREAGKLSGRWHHQDLSIVWGSVVKIHALQLRLCLYLPKTMSTTAALIEFDLYPVELVEVDSLMLCFSTILLFSKKKGFPIP